MVGIPVNSPSFVSVTSLFVPNPMETSSKWSFLFLGASKNREGDFGISSPLFLVLYANFELLPLVSLKMLVNF